MSNPIDDYSPEDDEQFSGAESDFESEPDSGDQAIPLQRSDVPTPEAGNPLDSRYVSPQEHVIEPSAESDESYSLTGVPESWKTKGGPLRVDVLPPGTASPPDVPPASRPRKTRRRSDFAVLVGCNLIVFLGSVCIMVLELVASRLIAKHVGSSLYTWTSVIGVVLAGITVGNFIGGWLADRFKPEKLIGRLFLMASVASFSVLWLDQIVATGGRPDEMAWPTWVFTVVAQMFFLPAMVLGTISPVVASLAIARSRRTGITVGNVYAWGALGSIVGTFLTGFWLIDAFGTRAIIAGTAGLLALIGVVSAAGQTVFRVAVVLGWMQFLCVATAAATLTGDLCADVGEVFGHMVCRQDKDILRLGNWLASSEDTVPLPLRNRLAERFEKDTIPGLEDDKSQKIVEWLERGVRDELDVSLHKSIQAAIAMASDLDGTIPLWTRQGELIGESLHTLGIQVFLRDDTIGQYHDESNYSYINVSDDLEGSDPVRKLQLDKLVHSYFNPADPTKLYYEYELVYAEVTEQVAAQWDRKTSVLVDPFPGLEDILPKLPDWVAYDGQSRELTAQSSISRSRRNELLKASRFGDYWLAVEYLAGTTRDPYWGGFSSTPLQQLPAGAAEDEFLKKRLTYETAFGTLNVYETLSEDDVEQLCAVGEAQAAVAWRKAVDELHHKSRRTSTFFIGGGGFVFPRWIEAEFPGNSRIDVAELDPAVKLAVQKMMGLLDDRRTAVTTHIGDARNVVDDLLQLPDGERPVYDFVYGDAFNDFSVPWHLTTQEFTEKVRDLMHADHGVYMINIIDVWSRTEYPKTDTLDDGIMLGFKGSLPDSLIVEYDEYDQWQFARGPLQGMESWALDDGTFRLAVRGRMSPQLKMKLLDSAEENDGLRDAILDLDRRSQQVQGGRFLAAFVNTVAQVFPNVYVFSTFHGAPSDQRDTYTLVASMSPLQLSGFNDSSQHWDTPPFAWVETDEKGKQTSHGQMQVLLHTAEGLVLTDDYAPVANLLRPVFVTQEH